MTAAPRLLAHRLAILAFAVASAAAGDEVGLRNGATFTGEVTAESLSVLADSGEILIPTEVIRSLSATDAGTVRIQLTDGETVEGTPRFDSIPFRDGLVLRKLRTEQIALLTISPPPIEEAVRRAHAEGRYPDIDRLRTTSPLIGLECPVRFELGLPSPPEEQRWTVARTRRIQCDDALSVSNILFELRERRSGEAQLHLTVNLGVLPPQDKLANLRAELTLDGSPAGVLREGRIDAEEGRITPVRLELYLDREQLRQWREGAPARLRVQVDAVDH